jgi:hypothetical protein
MEAFIGAPGDWSVGIGGESARIEFDAGFRFLSDDERAWFREEASKLFTELFDLGTARVVFSDECDECGAQLCLGKCHRCILREV